MGFINRFRKSNEIIAKYTVKYLSSIWSVYILLIWSLMPLIFPQYEHIILYISSGILQLVLLPLIMLGTKLNDKSAEVRSLKDHNTIKDISSDLKIIMSKIDSLTMKEIK